MRRLFFLFSFLLFTSLLFTGKVEAQKISAGIYFNPQAVTALKGEYIGKFSDDEPKGFSLWGVMEFEFEFADSVNLTVTPLYDLFSDAVGIFSEVSFKHKFGVYILGEKNIYDDENYLGLGIDFYISKANKDLNSLNDSSIFFELGSSVSYWVPSVALGVTIPVALILKE